MRIRSKHILLMIPALTLLTACDSPTVAPAEPVEDQMETDDFTADQPVVDDPMAGDTVVEDAPELGSGANEELTDDDGAESDTDAASEDGATVTEDQSADEETRKEE